MGKRKLQPMSPAETEVLSIIWRLKQATIQQIHEELSSSKKIVYKTVLTLVRRLEKKGYVKHKVKGKAHVYSTAVRREDVVRRTVHDFLNRLFAGEAGPLVQFLAEDGLLGPEEAKRLKEIIDKS
ncbi:MAG: BlaI/MecI/CopY family transcriptional regulator [Planctomycetota bacterium]